MPNTLLSVALSLLQDGNAPRLREGVNWYETSSDTTSIIIAIIGVVILATLGYIIVRLNRRHGDYQSVVERPVGAEDTFRKLCEVNGLSDSEGYLLRKVVFDLEIANPLLPFVDPGYLDTWASHEHDPNKAANAQRIRNKLFA